MHALRVMAAAALLLGLAGCAADGPLTAPSPSESAAEPTPTPTVTSEPTVSPALILGLDDLSIVDASGGGATARLDDPAAVLDLIAGALGAAPAPESTPFGDHYVWPDGVRVTVRGPYTFVRFDVAEAAGYELRTGDGIAVGSSRAEVEALSPFEVDYDGDGDGEPDNVGLEAREEPGTESLATPGEVGTSYLEVRFAGDTVTALLSPHGDWRDV
jgi:predicted small lipoprotein YifL